MSINKNKLIIYVAISAPRVSYGSSKQATLAHTAKRPYTVTALQTDDCNKTLNETTSGDCFTNYQ